jgi:hypothetical protein
MQHLKHEAIVEQQPQQSQQQQQSTLQQQQPPANSRSRREVLSLLSFGAPLALLLAARDSNNFQLRDLTPFARETQSQGLQDLGALVRGRVKATNDALVEGTRRLNEEVSNLNWTVHNSYSRSSQTCVLPAHLQVWCQQLAAWRNQSSSMLVLISVIGLRYGYTAHLAHRAYFVHSSTEQLLQHGA